LLPEPLPELLPELLLALPEPLPEPPPDELPPDDEDPPLPPGELEQLAGRATAMVSVTTMERRGPIFIAHDLNGHAGLLNKLSRQPGPSVCSPGAPWTTGSPGKGVLDDKGSPGGSKRPRHDITSRSKRASGD
jgi:hypothetical protein